MRKTTKRIVFWTVFWTTGAASLANLMLGWQLLNPVLAIAGVLGLCYVLLRWGKLKGWSGVRTARAERPVRAVARGPSADPTDTDALVEQMLSQGRFALLLRQQIAQNLSNKQLDLALAALEDNMALVPDGEVLLGQIDEAPPSSALEDANREDWELAARGGRVVRVERYFLDRRPVTNRQFHEFVVAGGYEQTSLWDDSIWPAVLDFVDRSGRSGPRFWKNSCYEAGREDHPVVGVNWYEAAAYARWIGKRLPTDAEWVKAGSWPVPVSSTAKQHRRYPWGNTMDRSRANLWGSGPGGTVDVNRFAEGVSVGGAYQLIGNVWEWTASNFQLAGPDTDEFVPKAACDNTLKSIRGAAFDTYFDNQATCQFQSGERVTARKHNIGFRLAVGVCDLMLGHPVHSPAEAATGESAPIAEEVRT